MDSPDAGMNSGNPRVKFLALWAILQAAKIALAMSLPLLVDEAFYAWEGRFPAWAYSDLPGLTAALTRIGAQIGGQHVLALRAPFLLLGAAIPWLVVRISRRWFGAEAGWWAGLLSLLMPLSGLLGVLALPDVPLVFAALLCLDSIARLRLRVDWPAVLCLAAALAIGALAHYRFALVLIAGLVGLLCDGRRRELLREPRFWLVLLTGALAWWPLLDWNIAHAGAGLRFQFLERNPWQFRAGAAIWLPIQLLLVTPALFVLLLATQRAAWQRREDHADAPWAMIAGIATVSVLGYFALGFFADRQRVSFHWPLAGWLVLVTAAPVVWLRWSAGARRAVLGVAGLGLLCALIFLGAASRPEWRSRLADSRFYPADFAGWQELDMLVRSSPLPAPGIVVAGNFAVAAELAHALDRRDIFVLDDPDNHKHGRAAQLQAWRLQFDPSARSHPLTLVIEDSATPMKNRLRFYHHLCEVFGALPTAEIRNIDHGRVRFLIYHFVGARQTGTDCAAPALAWFDAPAGKSVARHFTASGWAFKEALGLSAVQITVDGKTVTTAQYGIPMPKVAEYWRDSTDPRQPNVGFAASIDASSFAPGQHWLGLRLQAGDGSIETWAERPIRIDPR